ncbi:hypothetical protein JTB14_029469 [Gonioctena quinquepunctata]|nr:hypothetical protein JTB14_029469 [Gonioctena quinquepunctata]
METGFQKADGDNLAKIDSIMMALFFGSNPDFISAEMKGMKALGEDNSCSGVSVKPYSVVLKCNEVEGVVESVKCEDCPASQGGSKHAVASLTCIHRRSKEPFTTDVECYWKKSVLSSVGRSLKFIEATDMGK